jgi:hypothetical protein
MQRMFSTLLTLGRRHAPRKPAGVADPRRGAPARRSPAPMPRMRWY